MIKKLLKIKAFTLIILISQSVLANEKLQINLSKTTSISAPSPEKWTEPGGYFPNANYNNLYSISLITDVLSIKGSYKACFFYPQLFPHAFQQGFTQTYPQIVDNLTQNSYWGLGTSLKTDFPHVKTEIFAGTLTSKGCSSTMKKPWITPGNTFLYKQKLDSCSESSINTTPSQNPTISFAAEIHPKSKYIPEISMGYSLKNETYLSLYKSDSSKGISFSLVLTEHENDSTSWISKSKRYPEQTFVNLETSFFMALKNTTSTFSVGLWENPFGTPDYWCKNTNFTNFKHFDFATGFFLTSPKAITADGTETSRYLQFHINPEIKLKFENLKLNSNFLYQKDFLISKDRFPVKYQEDYFHLQTEMDFGNAQISGKSAFQYSGLNNDWTGNFSLNTKWQTESIKNAVTFSLKTPFQKPFTVKANYSISFLTIPLDSIGVDYQLDVKENKISNSLKGFLNFSGTSNNLKWKGKIEFSTIF